MALAEDATGHVHGGVGASEGTEATEWRDAVQQAMERSALVAMMAAVRDASHVANTLPSIRGTERAEREEQQRRRSVGQLQEQRLAEHDEIQDVLVPDVYTAEDPDEWLESGAGLSKLYISDENGNVVDWPWEQPQRRHTGGKRRRHRLDGIIINGLMHSMASGDMGANSTGVRRWRAYCASMNMSSDRVLDPNAPLKVKLEEEWHAMRFLAWLVGDEMLSPRTAATYFGQVQGWHAKEHGIKLAAGIKLSRLPAMLKGLRRVYGDAGRKVRRGMSPQKLRAAMDICYPNPETNIEHANIRAALALAFQGLLRGAEVAVDGKFSVKSNMTRADLANITHARLVVMMRPCKNMQHLSGKTVRLIVGGGGTC